MAVVEEYLPDEIAYGARGGPSFFTTVGQGISGDEDRTAQWSEELGEWDLGFINRTTEETEALITFFTETAKGRAYAFLFHDFTPDDDVDSTPRTVNVRFDDDWLQIRRIDVDIWSWENVRLIQVRDELDS